ncbi:MAG TPA: cytochrome c maturation protein CcmE [Acidimicrobiia bacterium]|jgi:cytochrome c-type biogenesis protein CcmE|nr:cytochrome c maturation protein CcmE [Acidimicrobiia bacterium]
MRRYWRFVVPAVLIAVVIAVLLVTLQSNLVFFNTPTELVEQAAADDRMRLGGEVVEGSVVEGSDGVTFAVTDGRETVLVVHTGAPQDLFQEGIGVVVEGTWDGSEFVSDSMIVSHDEQYRTEDGDVYEPGTDYQADS